MYQGPRREPEIDLEQILAKVRALISKLTRGSSGKGKASNYLTFGILLGALLVWLGTGVYQVSPGEMAVVRTFGKCCNSAGPGLHWYWPAPIGTRNIESVDRVRSMELGFSSLRGGNADIPEEADMITGDLNIVNVRLVVQYRISDLQHFLFQVSDPGESLHREIAPGRPEGRTLKDATEASLRLVVGQRSIDDVLTDKREEVQADTQLKLQQILDSYTAGIAVLSVRLQEVNPPRDVADSFQDVNRARQDKQTAINQAEAFEMEIIPRARGTAETIVQSAEAFKQERVKKAEGEAGRFASVLAEYSKAKEVTRQRMYLEAMTEILPSISSLIIAPDAGESIILNTGSPIVPVPQTSLTTNTTVESP